MWRPASSFGEARVSLCLCVLVLFGVVLRMADVCAVLCVEALGAQVCGGKELRKSLSLAKRPHFVLCFVCSVCLFLQKVLSGGAWAVVRVLTHQLVAGRSAALLLLQVWLSFQLRQLERLLGARRAATLALSALLFNALPLLALALLTGIDPYHALASGPLAVLWTMLSVHLWLQRRAGFDATWIVALQMLVITGLPGFLHFLTGISFAGLFIHRSLLVPPTLLRLFGK